jgi:DNA invertase Pin-like site-specific DNA recombinase
MTGVIYARYSEGPRQTDQSIEGQVADCRAYAEANGIDIIGIYADRHISGTSTDGREEFLRMMHDADAHRFDCVVTWKIDRFGRSREDIAVNKIRLKRAGVQLRYAKESVPEGPEGILLESLLEGLAEYYSADLRQKVARGHREGAKKGRLSAGSTPIGYKRAPDKTLVVVEDEAELVRMAFTAYAAGTPVKEIREMWRKKSGKDIPAATLYRMLRNEHYCSGTYTIQGVDVPVDPIIDKSLFDRAQTMHRGSRQNAAGRAKVEYLLSCKCTCELCGRTLQGVSGRGKLGVKYYYYKCPTKECGLKPIPRDQLEGLVLDHTASDVLTEEMIGKLTRRIMEIQEAERQQDPAAALRKELKDLKRKQANLLQAIEDGAGASVVTRLNEVDARLGELSLAIEQAELARPVIPEEIVRGWLQSFRAGDKNDPVFRRRLVRTFLAGVTVGPEKIVIEYNTKEKGPYSVSVQSDEWSDRSLTRTRAPYVRGSRIILVVNRIKSY